MLGQTADNDVAHFQIQLILRAKILSTRYTQLRTPNSISKDTVGCCRLRAPYFVRAST